MKIVQKKYTHCINDHVNIETIMTNEINFNIHIVYYINCLTNTNYFDWLKNQIDMVYNYNGTIYIIATLVPSDESKFRNRVLSMYSNIIIECNYENQFEYPGILKVWELGQIHSSSNDIILYFHSKGVTHHANYNSNRNDSYNVILKDVDRIKEIFSIFPSIDKIGYFSGGGGWIWYNFWFARGSYINSVEKPIKTQRRHYYEDWLYRKIDKNNYTHPEDENTGYPYPNTLINCYGFCCNGNFGNIGSYYCPNTNKMILL